MKRIFRFKKGQVTDWDEEMMHWMMDMAEPPSRGDCPVFLKDTTYIIEIQTK